MLIGLFAIQHSVMARQGFKRWWTRIVPPSVERSTYVLVASFALLLLYWQWQPIPALVWTVHNPTAAAVLEGIFWLGWVVLVASTFLLSHFELFGLSQVFARLFGKQPSEAKFRAPLLYRHVRHPIYLGVLLAVWATPAMTVGHLLFSVVITGYILIGIQLEERDLIEQFGDQYRRYRQHAPMLVPLPGRKFTPRRTPTSSGSKRMADYAFANPPYALIRRRAEDVSLVESERRCAGELSCLLQKLGKLIDQAAFVYH